MAGLHRKVTSPAHPWRRTIRTVVQAVLALAVLLPIIAHELDVDLTDPAWRWLAVAIAVLAAFARIMALPAVEAFLHRFAPWLAAGDVQTADVVAVRARTGQTLAGDASPMPTGTPLPAATTIGQAAGTT